MAAAVDPTGRTAWLPKCHLIGVDQRETHLGNERDEAQKHAQGSIPGARGRGLSYRVSGSSVQNRHKGRPGLWLDAIAKNPQNGAVNRGGLTADFVESPQRCNRVAHFSRAKSKHGATPFIKEEFTEQVPRLLSDIPRAGALNA